VGRGSSLTGGFLATGRLRMGVFTIASVTLERLLALLVAFFLRAAAFFVGALVAAAFLAGVFLLESTAVLVAVDFLLGAAFLSLAGFLALVTAFFFAGVLDVAVLLVAVFLVFLAVALVAACSAEAVLAAAVLVVFFTAEEPLAVLLVDFFALPFAPAFLAAGVLDAVSFFAAIRGTYPLRLVFGWSAAAFPAGQRCGAVARFNTPQNQPMPSQPWREGA